jgi:gluconokinase
MHITLGIDIGTSSVRVAAFPTGSWDFLDGTLGARSMPVARGTDGGETVDPTDLLNAVIGAMDDCLANLPPGGIIDAIGTSCFWHSVVPTNEAGIPIGPVLLWSDRRCGDIVDVLRQEQPNLPDVTGCPWHASFAIAKLEWWHRSGFQPAHRWLSPAEWVESQLLLDAGGPSTCMASASGCMDQAKHSWLDAYAPVLNPISDRPRVTLKTEYADRWPALVDVPWVPAIGDGAAANIGTGHWQDGRITVTVGTSVAVRRCCDGAMPHRPDGLWRYQLDPERWLIGGASSNGGSVWQWLCTHLKFDPDALADLRSKPPTVTVLPYYSGERAPWWQDHLTASIHGLTAGTSGEEIALAHLEAIAVHTSWIAAKLGVGSDTVLAASGNALQHSPLLSQCIADACGCTVEQQETGEQSLIGAARWAMHIINNCELTNSDIIIRDIHSSNINGRERMQSIAMSMNTLL